MKINKIILTFLVLSISSVAYSSHPNISVTVDGTTYYCSDDGNSSDCNSKVSSLRSQLLTCTNSTQTSWCVGQIWPAWKSQNSSCVSEGSAVCMEICDKDTSTSWCVSNCK